MSRLIPFHILSELFRNVIDKAENSFVIFPRNVCPTEIDIHKLDSSESYSSTV